MLPPLLSLLRSILKCDWAISALLPVRKLARGRRAENIPPFSNTLSFHYCNVIALTCKQWPKTLADSEQESRCAGSTFSPSLLTSLWFREWCLTQIHKRHRHGTSLIPRWVSLAISGSSAFLHSGRTWRKFRNSLLAKKVTWLEKL